MEPNQKFRTLIIGYSNFLYIVTGQNRGYRVYIRYLICTRYVCDMCAIFNNTMHIGYPICTRRIQKNRHISGTYWVHIGHILGSKISVTHRTLIGYPIGFQ